MYSYEDRIRAVKLYIKLGKRLRATIRQLGYPTKNSLIGWYREYERGQKLRVGYSRSRQKYSDQQKHAAVEHYLDTIGALPRPCGHWDIPVGSY
jgi:putative transposase